jgi:glucose/mannose transport system substrate-binding protein
MKRGLEILADPKLVFPSTDQMIDRDTSNQLNDVLNEFFANPAVTPEQAQAQFAKILIAAPK